MAQAADHRKRIRAFYVSCVFAFVSGFCVSHYFSPRNKLFLLGTPFFSSKGTDNFPTTLSTEITPVTTSTIDGNFQTRSLLSSSYYETERKRKESSDAGGSPREGATNSETTKSVSSNGLEFLAATDREKASAIVRNCAGKGGMVLPTAASLWKGYFCSATNEELELYFDYDPRKECPDDWWFVQFLVFVKNCFSLPKRRCLNRSPSKIIEPLPFPLSLFNQEALIDENVMWRFHSCDSFSCLNERKEGECRHCFNLTFQWMGVQRLMLLSMKRKNGENVPYAPLLTVKDVVEMKKGSLRIGLDVGGGTGTFAAQMARFNCTILTSQMNILSAGGEGAEGGGGETGKAMKGLPYLETIALRGLFPLHLPPKARLPFFDNTLDIIHTVNALPYLPVIEFEEILFEWDRVLRVGGVLWLENFEASAGEMPLYLSIIDLLSYERVFFNISPKLTGSVGSIDLLVLNCLIEKPVRVDEGALKNSENGNR